MATTDMKTMKLYHRVDRIHNELRARGIADGAPLAVADLTPHDQYHYLGIEAVDHAIAALGLGPGVRLLEIGSGIGGPARYAAATAGCRVTALELQPDLNETAAELTRRCSLAGLVTHQAGNILADPVEPGAHDAIMSLLCFLHIPDRARLFAAAFRALKPGGRFYIEDLTKRREPTPAQRDALAVKVQTPYLPTLEEYGRQLAAAGFIDVRLEDMSARWTDFTVERTAAFKRSRERNLRVHGPDIVEGLEDFYDTVSGLFVDGMLGGARITATRPGPAQARRPLQHRLARREDLPALSALMALAIGELLKPYLDAAQIKASRTIMGLDTQLVDDGTYFVIEDAGALAGCGGWSRRATLLGGNQTPGRDASPLDPARDAARVRAMYTHPDFTRCGVGRLVLRLCEDAARAEGFRRAELMATMAGEPLYRACGYRVIEPARYEEDGVVVPLLKMGKAL